MIYVKTSKIDMLVI